jgi:aromatic-L-amino-acid decarboxylase
MATSGGLKPRGPLMLSYHPQCLMYRVLMLAQVAYTSDQAHSCFKKACMVVGVEHVRLLPTNQQNEFAMDPDLLMHQMQQDIEQGLLPFFVSSTIGTTSSCAIDPVGEISLLSQR